MQLSSTVARYIVYSKPKQYMESNIKQNTNSLEFMFDRQRQTVSAKLMPHMQKSPQQERLRWWQMQNQ